jgi:hypothetical protein
VKSVAAPAFFNQKVEVDGGLSMTSPIGKFKTVTKKEK